MLAGHAGLVNHGDEILRILGRKIMYAGVVLARHLALMNPGDENYIRVAKTRRNETSQ